MGLTVSMPGGAWSGPDRTSAQLASFGTPLVDQLLGDALQRGRAGHFYLVGLNLQPHDLSMSGL